MGKKFCRFWDYNMLYVYDNDVTRKNNVLCRYRKMINDGMV